VSALLDDLLGENLLGEIVGERAVSAGWYRHRGFALALAARSALGFARSIGREGGQRLELQELVACEIISVIAFWMMLPVLRRLAKHISKA
jgi:hypothetical protein